LRRLAYLYVETPKFGPPLTDGASLWLRQFWAYYTGKVGDLYLCGKQATPMDGFRDG